MLGLRYFSSMWDSMLLPGSEVPALKRWAIVGEYRDQRSRLKLNPGAFVEG